MNPIMFSLFGIDIHWYSVLILVGIIIGLILLEREAKKFNYPKDLIFNICFWAIVIGIIGARLYYVIFNFSYYQNNILEIFAVWNGGLAIHGGLIAGVITVVVLSKKHHLNFLKLIDMAVPSIILAQAIGRWGNFFNSEAHGIRTTIEKLHDLWIPEFIIKGMNIGGIYYLPTFYFESLWCLLGFIILILIRKYKYIKIGATTCIYLIWYSIGRFFIEAWRTDSLMLGGFKIAQILSIALIITGLVYLTFLSRKGKYEELYHDINKNRVVTRRKK